MTRPPRLLAIMRAASCEGGSPKARAYSRVNWVGLSYPTSDEFEALLASQTALGRVGEPDDVGRVITGLLDDEQAWVNAQTIEVAGGYNI